MFPLSFFHRHKGGPPARPSMPASSPFQSGEAGKGFLPPQTSTASRAPHSQKPPLRFGPSPAKPSQAPQSSLNRAPTLPPPPRLLHYAPPNTAFRQPSFTPNAPGGRPGTPRWGVLRCAPTPASPPPRAAQPGLSGDPPGQRPEDPGREGPACTRPRPGDPCQALAGGRIRTRAPRETRPGLRGRRIPST